MHIDFLTLAALRDDLERLENARIQQVTQLDERAFSFELYAGERRYLTIDVHPQRARALLGDERGRRGVEQPNPLGLLLRKYARGGRLRRTIQPPWERILRFEIESEHGATTLVAELMGRRANLLLLDDAGVILECIVRAGADDNPYRVTLPQHPYVPPPPLTQRPPTALDEGDWRMVLAAAEPTMALHRLLLRELAGVSPSVARELAYRAAGSETATVTQVQAARLGTVVDTLFAPLDGGGWAPHVLLDESGSVVGFAPYRPERAPRVEPVVEISEGIARYFATRLDEDAYRAARGRVRAALRQARGRAEGVLRSLERQRIAPEEIERLRENGELLLAYQWQVPPRADSVELPDFEGEPRKISLDPDHDAVANARRYFARYEKKKRAAEAIPPRLEEARRDLDYVESLEGDLELAENRDEIDAVDELLSESGLLPARRARRRPDVGAGGPRRIELDGWLVLVGRNARQNDQITFRMAGSDDLWLHARGYPGSHVVIRSAGRAVPESVIERAAAIAAYYSRARNERAVPVIVTERRHVRRVSGERPGLVTVRNERTIHIDPSPIHE